MTVAHSSTARQAMLTGAWPLVMQHGQSGCLQSVCTSAGLAKRFVNSNVSFFESLMIQLLKSHFYVIPPGPFHPL